MFANAHLEGFYAGARAVTPLRYPPRIVTSSQVSAMSTAAKRCTMLHAIVRRRSSANTVHSDTVSLIPLTRSVYNAVSFSMPLILSSSHNAVRWLFSF